MKYAIHSSHYPNATYQQLADYAKEAGALILHLDPCGGTMGMSRDSLCTAAAYFRSEGVKIDHLITSLNFEGFDAAKIEEAKKAINLAAIMGADAIAITLGNPTLRHSEDKDFDHQGIIQAMRQMCEYGLKRSIDVWVIPANQYAYHISFADFFRAVMMSNFKIAWNVLNSTQLNQIAKSFARSYCNRMGHVYIEDGTPNADQDIIAYTPCKVGSGTVNICDIVKELLESGYTKAFSSATNDFETFRSYIEALPLEHVEVDPAKQLAYPMPEFTPPAGHPRVFIRPDMVETLRNNATMPQNSTFFSCFQEFANRPVDEKWGVLVPENGKIAFQRQIIYDIEAKAYAYAIFGDEAKGREAIQGLHNFYRTAKAPYWEYNCNGLTIYTIGLVYDWCYPLLSAEDKQSFHDAVIAIGQHLEVGYPPVKLTAFSGHGPEGQLMRDLMCAAIAMFDEYPHIYQNTAGRFFKEFITDRKFLNSLHCFHEGAHYFSYRMQWDMFATILFDRMGYPKIFGEEQLDTVRHYLHVYRPDGYVMENGDTNNREKNPGKYATRYTRTFLWAANYWKDPYLKAAGLYMLEHDSIPDPYGNQTITPTEFLLFNDPHLTGCPKDTLPLLHHQPAPKGGLLIHTNWKDGIDSNDAICELKINHYWHGGHQHLDAGAFQIYYKGLLATDDGYYQSWMDVRCADRENRGYTGFGSTHHYNYTRRTIAHNCMLVYDPKERFRDNRHKVHANDGGQRLPCNGLAPASSVILQDPAKGYRTGTMLARAWGPNDQCPCYAYLKGDITAAYSAKMESYQRSFLYLRMEDDHAPMALLVFDRVIASDPAFKKTWLCHGLSDPIIKNGRSVFTNTAEIPGDGIYCGRYNGKLTIDTLLPHNPRIASVGGPGGWHTVDGVNYPAKLGEGQRQEGHGWRLEISPSIAKKEDHFFHVLQVGDADGAEALAVQSIETDCVAGAVLADRVAIFSKANSFDKQVEFVFAGEGNYEIHVADLLPGQWTIHCNGKEDSDICVDSEEGIAVFNGPAGSYHLARKEV